MVAIILVMVQAQVAAGGPLPLVAARLRTAGIRAGAPVVEAWVGGSGPLRMRVDTGAQSSVLSPEVVARVGLSAAWRVEVVTAAGSRIAPAAETEIALGGETTRAEVLFYDPGPGVDGILGQNALSRWNYVLDWESGAMRVVRGEDGEPTGERVPFDVVEGRMLLSVGLPGERRRMVLDSGASHVVLFGGSPAGGRVQGRLETGTGVAEVDVVRLARVSAAGRSFRGVIAAVAPAKGRAEGGLLPASMLGTFYVNNTRRYLVLASGIENACTVPDRSLTLAAP